MQEPQVSARDYKGIFVRTLPIKSPKKGWASYLSNAGLYSGMKNIQVLRTATWLSF